jgi:sec-independent protein translocase protein TatB
MFDIGFSELFLVAVIGLLILGPEKLPQAAKTVGGWVRKIRTAASNLTSEIERELEVENLKKELANKNAEIMQQASDLSKKLNRPVESILSLDDSEKPTTDEKSIPEEKQGK